MSKKVLGTNCKITNLPAGWSAKVNDQGTAIITVPAMLAGMFGGTMQSKSTNINGFTAESFDQTTSMKLVGAEAGIDESGFHNFSE